MPFEIVRNDITNMQVDAIVNTANPRPVIGSGTDTAIHKKAGPELLQARRCIGRIEPGHAAITPAYALDAKYVIHTVGPVWLDGAHNEAQLLRNCYENALHLAAANGCDSIAFPLISTGNYVFPKDQALQIAISVFSAFLLEHEMDIYLVVYDRKSFKLSEKPDGVFEGMKSVQIIEDGEIFLGVEAFFECDNSRGRIYYKIYKNTDDLDVDVTLYMGDINKIIKLKLPIACEGSLIGQAPFGTDELYMDGRENVAGRFVALDKGDTCVALFNRGVYGSHYENGSLYTSLVRGVTYCAHPIADRQLIPLDRFTKKIDQGENSFSFRLTVTDREKLERKALEFTEKPYGLNIFPIPSESAEVKPLHVAIGDDVITLDTVKKAYGGEGMIFRLVNNTPTARSTDISINGQTLTLEFGKYEVKTVIYENGKLEESYEMII